RDKPDEGTNDAVELVVQLRIWLDVAAHHRDLQTAQGLPRGAKRTVIARAPVFSPTVHTEHADLSSAQTRAPAPPRMFERAGSRLTARASKQSPARSAGRGLEAARSNRQN